MIRFFQISSEEEEEGEAISSGTVLPPAAEAEEAIFFLFALESQLKGQNYAVFELLN